MIKNALIAFYILLVLAISAVARAGVLPNNAIDGAEVTDSSNYNYSTRVGEVAVLADGTFVLVLESQNTVLLQSDFDLTPFVGFKVMISGIEQEHQLAPNYGSHSVDPLPGMVFGSKTVVFVVLGISEVTQ
ncbi:hypothetical protein [Bdellovibrio sp. HCB288]|uniref:hypothetical protein n=1 Tax=Bdellovibrio sp. HCB288 TaxID=3394355 RepID=UPI0039B37333